MPSRNSIAKNTEPDGGLAEVGDVDDVLVADLRGRLRLLHEARDEVGLAREVLATGP